MGSALKGDNNSFRHDVNKRAKNDTAESISEFFPAAVGLLHCACDAPYGSEQQQWC